MIADWWFAVGDVVVVLTTVPAGGKGEEIAQALVDERLAACVNILAPMTSIYRWRGAVERDTEQQLIIKTSSGRVAAVQARLAALHPYERTGVPRPLSHRQQLGIFRMGREGDQRHVIRNLEFGIWNSVCERARERATRTERAGAAARERACRGVRGAKAPRLKISAQLVLSAAMMYFHALPWRRTRSAPPHPNGPTGRVGSSRCCCCSSRR